MGRNLIGIITSLLAVAFETDLQLRLRDYPHNRLDVGAIDTCIGLDVMGLISNGVSLRVSVDIWNCVCQQGPVYYGNSISRKMD